MNAYLKGGCLAIYLLAVLGSYIAFPFGIALTLKVVAVTLVAAHALGVADRIRQRQEAPGAVDRQHRTNAALLASALEAVGETVVARD